ncbi:MAG: glycine betaine/L-proline transport binding subunit [Pseudomonadota bacterium]|jgi:glycine betaine/proline transport system ATP-binding protein
MAIKLEVKNLYKIFGEHPGRAFKLLESGKNKQQIFTKTGLGTVAKIAALINFLPIFTSDAPHERI